MSKISWPNAASRCPTKRSGCGASRSVQHTLAGSSVDTAGWATPGTWTRSSSPSRDGGTILWRAVDQDGDVIDILVQARRDCRAATRFFRKLLKGQERQPVRLVTDKLSSYRAAHQAVMPSVAQRTDRYENNRAEVSHQPTRQRERQMRLFKSAAHAQRVLSVHGLVLNLFRVGRHLLRSAHHRLLRMRAYGAINGPTTHAASRWWQLWRPPRVLAPQHVGVRASRWLAAEAGVGNGQRDGEDAVAKSEMSGKARYYPPFLHRLTGPLD